MSLPIETLEKSANEKLELVLSWSNERLLDLEGELISFQETLMGESIFFDVLIRKDELPNQYRVIVFVWDDAPAREDFPVQVAVTLEI